ncbi:MAG: tRNA lysidine(34) synthetase TilS [Candidatus Moranbacteria bacterium]|nr:tRNA lysidine(34) synthetase TilS [Candidatus Moranbacteria bacterium]
MQNLLKKIQENIFRHELLERGNKIIVGISGGPDSVCLLDIFSKLQKNYGLELVVAHVNYGLRGKDSEKDEKLVKKLAEKYKLPCEVFQISNFKFQISENNLRDIRYKFFEKISKKHGSDRLALAHNRNDQAETVMLRLLRGSGLRGLGAMKFRNENIIRPLLNISRKEILEYLRKNRIPYRTDKSNLKNDFTRNKVRNQLFPFIEKNFNPNFQEALFHLAAASNEDYGFIRRYAEEWLGKKKNIPVKEIGNLHPAIRNEVLRQAIGRELGNLQEVENSHLDEILKILKSTKNKRQKLSFKGLKIERIGDKLVISKL